MTELLTPMLKISLVIFMAGNLLDMGLRLDPRNALRGLRNRRFVGYTLLWGFVLGPALAYLITRIIPLETPYAIGLLLMGMTPCAPFLPILVDKANGDLGYAAALMLLAAVGTIVFMPVAVPLMVEGLTVSAWTISRPLLLLVFLPLAAGMLVLRTLPAVASGILPAVKKVTGVATIATGLLCVLVFGKALLGVPGSLAVAAQLVFFFVLTVFTYWLGFGLQREQKVVLSAGMATRNLGVAIAPLLSIAGIDQRAIVMVILGIPMTLMFGLLSARWFGQPASSSEPGIVPRAGKHPG